MSRLILLSVIIILSTRLYGQTNCFENCWENLDNSDTAIPERNYKIISQLVGCKVPNFSVKSIDDQEFNTQKLKGKILVISFWFTTCAPCVAEMPALNRLVKEYSHKNVVFLAFGRDTKNEISEFLRKHKFQFSHISSDYDLTKKYCVLAGWPMNLVIDKDGILRYIASGGYIDERAQVSVYNKMKPVIEKYTNQ